MHKYKPNKKTISEPLAKGFTLIELIVVIAIIGLLATVVLTSLSVSRGRAEISKFNTEYKSLSNALELYRQSNAGQYPDSASNPGVGDSVSISDLILSLGDYMKQTPISSPAVINFNYNFLPTSEVYYKLNPPDGSYPRYSCGTSDDTQDYVLFFTPTVEAIDSDLFGTLWDISGPGSASNNNPNDLMCISVNQK